MSTENTVSGGMLHSNRDNSKIFIFNNSFESGEVNNSDYDDLVIPKGTVMGRVAATGMLVPLESGASDGSQYPVGILAGDYTIEDGDTAGVRICTGGEVDQALLVLQGSDDLDTIISGRQLRDRLAADTVGIILRDVEQLSNYDNE